VACTMFTTTNKTECRSIKSEYHTQCHVLITRDMLATLGSFAIAPLWSLQRQGIHLTPEEEMAHVAVWRHIGWVHNRRIC
jgi:hypothetical protein